MAEYRDPLRSASEGFGLGLEGLVQGLMTARQERLRQEDIARERENIEWQRWWMETIEGQRQEERTEDILRDDAQRAEDQALTADANARNAAAADLQSVREAAARLQGEEQSPEVSLAIARSQALIRALEAVIASPRGQAEAAYQRVMSGGVALPTGEETVIPAGVFEGGEAPEQVIPRMMPNVPVGVGIAGVAGTAEAAGREREQSDAVRARNTEYVQSALNRLMTGTINFSDPQVVAQLTSLLVQAEGAMNMPLLPGAEDLPGQLKGVLERMLSAIPDDPNTVELREIAMRIARADASTAESQAAIAQYGVTAAGLANVATKQGIRLGEVTYDQAVENLRITQSTGFSDAMQRWRETGMLATDDPFRQQVIDALFGQRSDPEAAFLAASQQNYKQWNERILTQDELMDIAKVEGERRNELLSMEMDQMEYIRSRQPLTDALEDVSAVDSIVERAILQGDSARLRELLYTLVNDGDSDLAVALRAGGVTAEGLKAQIRQAEGNSEFTRRSRELALEEAGLAMERARLEGMTLSADVRSRMAASLTPDEIDAWYLGLSPEDRALVGGDIGLAGMRRDAAVMDFLAREPVREHAYQMATALMSTTQMTAVQQGLAAESLYALLLEATGDPQFAGAMTEGALRAWERGNTAWDMEVLKHDLNMKLLRAQANELNARASQYGTEETGMTPESLNALRGAYAEERQAWRAIQDSVLGQMQQNECSTLQWNDRLQMMEVTGPGRNSGTPACQELNSRYAETEVVLVGIADNVAALTGTSPRPYGQPTTPVPIPDPNAPASEAPASEGPPRGTPANPMTPEALNEPPPGLVDVGVTDITENQITQMAEILRSGRGTASQLRVELAQTGKYTPEQRDAIVAMAEQRARMMGNRQ